MNLFDAVLGGALGILLTFGGGPITLLGYVFISIAVLWAYIALNLIKLRRWAWAATVVLVIVSLLYPIIEINNRNYWAIASIIIAVFILIYLYGVRKDFDIGK